MYYVTHRSHRVEKYKFGVTCPTTLLLESLLVPPEDQKKCVDVLCPDVFFV
jgi:hypothetical protein